VIEPNPQLPPLIREITRNYSNYFFQNRNVSIVNTNARNYLKQDGRKWDIIELSTIESAVSSIGGIYSTSTDYQLTVEAFQDYLDHLNESGIFTLSVPLKFPPRNVLKIAHLCKKALENLGVNFSESIVILRNWSTGTILVKRTPFNAEELEILKSFCHNMFFDFVYYPGITETESNRYNIVEDSMYYSSIQKLFTDPKFVKKNYIFNVRAATDNQPYFHYFFKLSKIPELFRTTGKKWLFVVEGGYIVLSVTFVSTLILSYIFIGGPGLFLRRKLRSKRSTILIYFGCIALSYMFIEIMLIERFNKYLDSPIYSNSIIIASLLIFSGIGSYFTDFLTEKKRSVVLAAVLFLSGYFFLFLFLSDRVYAHLMRAHVIWICNGVSISLGNGSHKPAG
jgi:hypothetical protein